MPTAIHSQLKEKGAGRSSAEPKPKKVKEVKKKKRKERTRKKPKTKPIRLPKKATYPRWWKEVRKAGINFATAGIHTIIPAQSGIRHLISLITFTVGGATNITFLDGSWPFSGPMDFGGPDEPRGIVINMGEAPLMLNRGSPLMIHSAEATQVSGFVTYMSEIAETPPER